MSNPNQAKRTFEELEKLDRQKAAEEELEQVVNEVMQIGGITEWTPNAVGQPVSTEPRPHEMVAEVIKRCTKQAATIKRLRALVDHALDATP